MTEPDDMLTITVQLGPDGRLVDATFPDPFPENPSYPIRAITKDASGRAISDERLEEPPTLPPRKPWSDEQLEGIRTVLDEAPATDDPNKLAMRATFEKLLEREQELRR
ncbi:hypothetical protein [Candidatus Palauibacter sp.]|uniref:hypothetical protein n=1 Tax=Candidatus Palauibacter sp. TaxID=3101350 RepID=UPI003B521E29